MVKKIFFSKISMIGNSGGKYIYIDIYTTICMFLSDLQEFLITAAAKNKK